jgi:shikimate kinase
MDWNINQEDLFLKMVKDSYLAKSKKIIIAGAFCSGKTTLGKLLSNKLNIKFYDLDECFNAAPNEDFRYAETNALGKFIRAQKKSYILALGGGTLLDKRNIEMVKSSSVDYVLFLSPPFQKIIDNLNMENNLEKRKFLPQAPMDLDNINELFKKYELRNSAKEHFKYFKKARIV